VIRIVRRGLDLFGLVGGRDERPNLKYGLHGILDCIPDVVQCVSDVIEDETLLPKAASLRDARQGDEQQKHAQKTAEEMKSHFGVLSGTRRAATFNR
jgi:hypothetical protein